MSKFYINGMTEITSPESLHQTVLDHAYKHWQNRPEDDRWSYNDMLLNCRKLYGQFAEFLVIIGKWNQQVGNGGIYQYWDNGYASENRRSFFAGGGDDMYIHDRLIDYSEEYLPEIVDEETYTELMRILKACNFEDIDDEQWIEEEVWDEDEEEYVEEDVENPEYGRFNWDFDTLSRDYYKINEALMEGIEKFLQDNNILNEKSTATA